MATTAALGSARRERGFTLIELLVVVIIVGVLAAVAVPVYLNQRAKAYRAQAMQDARQVAAAYETWAVDNPGQRFPDICHWCTTTTLAAAPGQLQSIGVDLSPGASIHSFDISPYINPSYGLRDGQAYCIEVRAPRTPAVIYYSYAGGFISTTCQATHTP